MKNMTLYKQEERIISRDRRSRAHIENIPHLVTSVPSLETFNNIKIKSIKS